MHTAESQRGRGVGEALLRHLLTIARAHDYERIFLETGTVDAFAPARRLYQRMGFETCEPFGDYTSNPYSTCMIRDLHDLET
jgi:putative acetyltransferase